jgi:hypothetical protein
MRILVAIEAVDGRKGVDWRDEWKQVSTQYPWLPLSAHNRNL